MNFQIRSIKIPLFDACLIALLGKTFLTGNSIADALVLISLVISICYTKFYLGKKRADLTDEQTKLIEDTANKVRNMLAANSLKRGGQ